MHYLIQSLIYCIVLLFLGIFLFLLRSKKIEIALNYRALFKMGIIFLPIGIIMGSSVLWTLGIIYLIIGLVNKERWGRNRSGKNGVVIKGAHSYGDPEVRVWTRKDAVVRMGKYCSIADNVCFIIDGNHNMHSFSTFPFFEKLGWKEYTVDNWGKENPSVGNDVWICSDAVIYSGVHIGDGAVVAGQSVVTKSVPPYAIVAGNPAVIKKYRFENHIIDKLLKYKWWDLPEEVIKSKLAPHALDIEKFCDVLEEIRNK